jgi:hypothetical protein
MAIVVDWDNPQKTTLLFTYTGAWEWSEHEKAILQGNELVEETDHNVQAIIDIRNGNLLPTYFMSGIKSVGTRTHPRIQTMVMVGASPFIRSIIGTVSRVRSRAYTRKMILVATIEEARAITGSTPS